MNFISITAQSCLPVYNCDFDITSILNLFKHKVGTAPFLGRDYFRSYSGESNIEERSLTWSGSTKSDVRKVKWITNQPGNTALPIYMLRSSTIPSTEEKVGLVDSQDSFTKKDGAPIEISKGNTQCVRH